MSRPTLRAALLVALAGSLTVISSFMSVRWNFSDINCVAREDSDEGSWDPPADRLLPTGIPKVAAAKQDQNRDSNDPAGCRDGQKCYALQHVAFPRWTAQSRRIDVTYQRPATG